MSNGEVWGAAGDFDSIDDARKYGDTRYPGVRWVDANVSLEEALAYYDAMEPAFKCGFCGKRAFQVDQMVEGPSAAICGECIKAFHEDLTKEDRSE